MLRHIAIENFALISRLELEFEAGLNLISGETGSGKSILVDAVGLLVGTRASQEMIRQGFETARVEGLFCCAHDPRLARRLAELGIPDAAGELSVRREISLTGSNRIYLNDRLVTLGTLASLGGLLVEIHGQHSQQQLLSPSSHLEFLDVYAGAEPLRQTVAGAFSSMQEARRELTAIRDSEQERLQRLDLLRFQLQDIDRLGLTPGLDQELEAERSLLSSAERRLEAASELFQSLYEEEAAVLQRLDRLVRRAEELARLDPHCEDWIARLQEGRYALEEVALQARDYLGRVEFDPRRLEQIEERLDEIAKARRKYGATVEEILRRREQIAGELERLDSREMEASRLESELKDLEMAYQRSAAELSARRHQAASRLAAAVERELAELAMQQTVFQVALTPAAPSENGLETAEFLISPNPGEEPRPLARIASGGELSRIMLALKTVVKGDTGPPTLVFDEVDSGIGGRAANSLGQKLGEVARRRQVFCVTHLPQLAAFAHQHFRVDKQVRDGRTEIVIQRLDEAGRIEELARMLAGDRASDTTLRQARELLTQGRRQTAR
jgi:DNA repair protein RecN (Recombination protein N)